MSYCCCQCDYISVEPGNCPVCNIRMFKAQGQEEQNVPGAIPPVTPGPSPEVPVEEPVAPEAPPVEPLPEVPQEGGGTPPAPPIV